MTSPKRARADVLSERYTMQKSLGRGMSCSVYRGESIPLVEGEVKKVVAIKVFDQDNMRIKDTDKFEFVVRREADMMRSIGPHNNIIQLIETLRTSENVPVLVLEFAENPLSSILKKARGSFSLSAGHLKGYFAQLMTALSYCHEKGIMHRDVKPDNILVTRDNILKLSDFGTACPVVSPNREGGEHTRVVITQWYRPPEVLLGYLQYDEKVDIWSAGCVLAELLFCGDPLFPCKVESAQEQLNVIWRLRGTPRNVDSLPEGWRESARKALLPGGAIPEDTLMKSLSTPGNKHVRSGNFTKGAVDLINQMLQTDPRKRLSSPAVLTSHYMRGETPKPYAPEHMIRVTLKGVLTVSK